MGADRSLQPKGTSARHGEPDPAYLGCAGPGAPLVGPGATYARIRLAFILGDSAPSRGSAVYAGAFADPWQGHLAACSGEARGDRRMKYVSQIVITFASATLS